MSNNVDQIKERLDLVDTISSYIKLEKAGLNYKACCPFHNEKTPSFFVSPSKNIWHCFSCSMGGDVISFVMEIEHIEFIEALKILAKRAGIELMNEDPRVRSERDRLFAVLEEAKNFYKSALSKNKAVLDYLIKERGLEITTVKEFEIGFAQDGWRNLYDYLRQKNYSDLEIEKAGLIINKLQTNPKLQIQDYKQNSFYDRFRSRVMFPINDQSGRTVAFGGRVFNLEVLSPSVPKQNQTTVPAKYINSPETPLYNKSKVLYGFDKAKSEIIKNNSCVLVEGYMDAVMSHQAGVKNTVAASGTALTPEHLNLISRLTKKVIMSFDADEAGISATKRSIDLLLSRGFEVNVVSIKEKDPADLIKNLGREDGPLAWQKALSASLHIIDFYLNFLVQKYGSDKRALARETIKIIFPYLLSVSNEMERSHWFKKIANVADIKEDSVWREFERAKKKPLKENNFVSGAAQNQNARWSAERDLTHVEKKRKDIEERIIAVLFSLHLRGLIGEEVKNKIGDCEKIMSLESATILNSVFSEKNGLNEKDLLKLKSLALEAELIYNNAEEMGSDLLTLFEGLKKEEKRERREILARDIKNLEKENKTENENIIIQKVNEFNKISKEI